MTTLETFGDNMTPYRSESAHFSCAYELSNQGAGHLTLRLLAARYLIGVQALGFRGLRVEV